MKLNFPFRNRRQGHHRMQLRMVPMIDVVFLLLVFFLLAANFRSREGYLPAELPTQAAEAEQMELEPLQVHLGSVSDGGCRVQVASDAAVIILPDSSEAGFEQLSRNVLEVIHAHGRTLDDAVKIIPERGTKWDHVVKTYNALWHVDLRNIIFAIVD